MERRISTSNIQLGSAVGLTICCLMLLQISASAQSGDPAKIQQLEMDKRELQLRDSGRGNIKETDPKRAQAIKDQLNEDFQRILKLHNDMVRAIASKIGR